MHLQLLNPDVLKFRWLPSKLLTKLPDIVQDNYHVGGRQGEDHADPRPLQTDLRGGEAPDVGPGSHSYEAPCLWIHKVRIALVKREIMSHTNEEPSWSWSGNQTWGTQPNTRRSPWCPPSASQTCIVNDINKVCLEDNKRLLTYLPATLYLALPISWSSGSQTHVDPHMNSCHSSSKAKAENPEITNAIIEWRSK